MQRLIPMIACLLLSTAHAEEPMPPPEMAPAAQPPVGVDVEGLEPEVSIIQRDDAKIEEYRLNGQLYMVKIVPRFGPPYYLIDSTGDGELNARRSELDPAMVVPNWMIFRW